MSYMENHKAISKMAKEFWSKNKINESKVYHSKEPEIVLDFFPFPSGIGLHVGHTLGYIATDVYARFKRLQGKNILFAMGYDAFGLPAEQFAIETGTRPETTTKKNIANISRQLYELGLMHDPNRVFSTTDADYYKWTQWIFLQLYNSYFDEEENKAKPITHLESRLKASNLTEEEIYKELSNKRLAYLDSVEVNWCPGLGTVLSDEEVINGKSERGNHPVFKKQLVQWILRITTYSKRLLENLDALDWPDSVKEMQRNWIGLSQGHELTLKEAVNERIAIEINSVASMESVDEKCNSKLELKAFTTRLDTISGATFCAISIDHPEVARFARTPEARAFLEKNKGKEKIEGSVFTGVYMQHPDSARKLPVYIADYVLKYGTAAVCGVPAHDERDFKLAKQHELDIIPTIIPDDEWLKEHDLTLEKYKQKMPLVYSAKGDNLKLFNGNTAKEEITHLEKNDWAIKKTITQLRDWIFSRQRYWGEPFPIVLDKHGNAYALEEECLPVKLPELEDFKNESDSQEITKPLDKLPSWRDVNLIKLDNHTARIVDESVGAEVEINGKQYLVESGKRETNTMPNWAGSCWYYLRYLDPKNDHEFISQSAQNYWLGKNWNELNGKGEPRKLGAIDLYLGGAEHAVLHLLYARFWHMVLYDLGHVINKEPFNKLFNQGMILGSSYSDSQGKYYALDEVEKKNNQFVAKVSGEQLFESIGKIGKRYKNGVAPETITDEFSVDALRLYMMYLGPLEQNKPWNYEAIKGMVRFLEKIWSLEIDEETNYEDSDDTKYDFDQLIFKVQEDCKNLKFNTAIAAIIIFINKHKKLSKMLYRELLIVLAPFIPHIAEYLFIDKKLQNNPNNSIFDEKWPEKKNIQKQHDKINVVFTLNGKKKAVQEFAANANEDEIKQYAQKLASNSKKIIVIYDNDKLIKLVNVVE